MDLENARPKSGQAPFVQAEVLRAIEKLRWEAQNNGNINWDDRFEMLIDYIDKALTSQPCFSDLGRESIRDDPNRLRQFTPVNEMASQAELENGPYIEDDLYDRPNGETDHVLPRSPAAGSARC